MSFLDDLYYLDHEDNPRFRIPWLPIIFITSIITLMIGYVLGWKGSI